MTSRLYGWPVEPSEKERLMEQSSVQERLKRLEDQQATLGSKLHALGAVATAQSQYVTREQLSKEIMAIPIPKLEPEQEKVYVPNIHRKYPRQAGVYWLRFKGYQGWSRWYVVEAIGSFPYLRLAILSHMAGDLRMPMDGIMDGQMQAEFVLIPEPK